VTRVSVRLVQLESAVLVLWIVACLAAPVLLPRALPEPCPGVPGQPCGCGKVGCAVPCGACCPTTPCPIDDPTSCTDHQGPGR
jgi:hypothetical protein